MALMETTAWKQVMDAESIYLLGEGEWHGLFYPPSDASAVIPEYVPGEVVSFTDSCVQVATQAPVDGETALFMGRHA
jgi:hypothetical protein